MILLKIIYSIGLLKFVYASTGPVLAFENANGLWTSTSPSQTTRVCYCVENMQTSNMYVANLGTVKAFWSNDCTGNYNTYDSSGGGKEYYGMTWMNSISVGPSGSSSGPYGCPSCLNECWRSQ
jgi:hypothetical protein